MNLEIINTGEMTFDQVLAEKDSIYILHRNGLGAPTLTAFTKMGSLNISSDKLILKITDGDQEEIVKPVEEQPRKRVPKRTYKIDSWDDKKIIEVESRIDGSIRVNFKEKESANLYFDYIRDFFYKSTTGADWLSVSTIYKELKIVNWEPENCDDWVWPTLDGGTCRYISEVAKTKNKHMWGFTLTPPQKFYGMKA